MPPEANNTSLEAAIMAIAQAIQNNNGSLSHNPYKFSVYRNAAANTGNGAYAKITFDTEEFDTGGNFASGTFTVPVSGFYQYNWLAGIAITAGSTDTVAVLYKNGVAIKWGNEVEGQGGTGGGALVKCEQGDTMEIYCYGSTTSALLVADPKNTYFTGYLVSRT